MKYTQVEWSCKNKKKLTSNFAAISPPKLHCQQRCLGSRNPRHHRRQKLRQNLSEVFIRRILRITWDQSLIKILFKAEDPRIPRMFKSKANMLAVLFVSCWPSGKYMFDSKRNEVAFAYDSFSLRVYTDVCVASLAG
jgi:hypothetical protein